MIEDMSQMVFTIELTGAEILALSQTVHTAMAIFRTLGDECPERINLIELNSAALKMIEKVEKVRP